MSVVQRFYPEFFFSATHSQILGPDEDIDCHVALFDEEAVFNANHGVSFSLPYQEISDTDQPVTLQVTRDGVKLLFSVPEISWNDLLNSHFRHVIIWRQLISGGKNVFYPLMHIDLGTSMLPIAGGFTLTPDEICIPKIDLSYEVCT